MEELHIDIYTFFGVVEVALVLLVVAAVFVLRSKSLSARVQTLQSQLRQAVDAPPPVSFEQYLRDEVLRNQGLYDQAAAATDEEEKRVAELLQMRRQFLELEVAAREFENNPVQFQATLASGFGEMLEQWRPEAETTEVQAAAAVPADVESADSDSDESPEAVRSSIDTHDQEFDRLKQVILNQQDAMSALRAELQARKTEIPDLASILQKLDEFEQHDAELQQCLKMLEDENQQLKKARAAGGGGGADIGQMDDMQLSGLKDMIGNQQSTIGKLQSLIKELAPEAGKAAELATALGSIHRANQELGGCVAVLEDENAMLREELDAVNAQLQAQEQAAQVVVTAEPELAVIEESAAGEDDLDDGDEAALSPDEEKYQLEIKVQELEALVEFKDAAIEELEKQYNALESRYLKLTGEK